MLYGIAIVTLANELLGRPAQVPKPVVAGLMCFLLVLYVVHLWVFSRSVKDESLPVEPSGSRKYVFVMQCAGASFVGLAAIVGVTSVLYMAGHP
jgi:hypothetical protein